MTQMWLLPLAYAYYDEIEPDAREKLITVLLAQGRIHRASIAGADDVFTSGGTPNDWSRAGYVGTRGAVLGFLPPIINVKLENIPETENHVLMIATARYLTNQLLYQRTHDIRYDNRRNGDASDSRPHSMDHVLSLLRNYLRNDFAEYNAKSYQVERRHALLNLYSYAYDPEVKLAARMVLDYVSAHVAVSTNDLRRLVPFRRRDEGDNRREIPNQPGFMDVSLTDGPGADNLSAHFVLHAGNTRAYGFPSDPDRRLPWTLSHDYAPQLALEAICDHRLAPSVHDLFVNDLHRRFFQRLHRHWRLELDQQYNCDNMEIYAASPSYLITGGGRPARWVIGGDFGRGYYTQNLGVAVPISFMPTGASAGPEVSPHDARELIQILHFSDDPEDDVGGGDHGGTENYGVAPDFACGFQFYFPDWTWTEIRHDQDGRFFVNRRSTAEELAGFYLAIHKQGDFVLLEALDTWLHPEVSYEEFQARVATNNPNLSFASGQEAVYTTYFGNRIHYVIWHNLEHDNHQCGSKILYIEYSSLLQFLRDSGTNPAGLHLRPLMSPEVSLRKFMKLNVDPSRFLSGTILNSPRDAVVEIRNPFLGTTLTLDWSDPQHPVRIAENGEVQEAGRGHQVWVDFDWRGPTEGDFYRPFNTITAALSAVAEPGVIRIMPGATRERPTLHKRVRLTAVRGTVTIGAHD